MESTPWNPFRRERHEDADPTDGKGKGPSGDAGQGPRGSDPVDKVSFLARAIREVSGR